MNNAEYLCHSSGPWKKHKYFQKIGEGANAIYRYTKQAGSKVGDAIDDASYEAKKAYRTHITGEEYKLRESAAKKNSESDKSYAELAAKEGRMGAANRALKESERNGRKAAQASYDYRTKSLKGIAESAPGKAKNAAKNTVNKVKRRFKTTTKATVTDTMTGEKRTVDSNDPFYKSLEKATKKKKKLKHEGMYSSEYLNHAEEVARGQAKIDALFGR